MSVTYGIGQTPCSFEHYLVICKTYVHRVSKKTSKIIFVITTSNFHPIWQFLAQRWQID